MMWSVYSTQTHFAPLLPWVLGFLTSSPSPTILVPSSFPVKRFCFSYLFFQNLLLFLWARFCPFAVGSLLAGVSPSLLCSSSNLCKGAAVHLLPANLLDLLP